MIMKSSTRDLRHQPINEFKKIKTKLSTNRIWEKFSNKTSFGWKIYCRRDPKGYV